MGYRIVYGKDVPVPQMVKGGGKRLRAMIAIGMLVFSFLVRAYWPEGCQKLCLMVMPEGASETQAAAEFLLRDLKAGVPVSDALTAFCRQILDYDDAY